MVTLSEKDGPLLKLQKLSETPSIRGGRQRLTAAAFSPTTGPGNISHIDFLKWSFKWSEATEKQERSPDQLRGLTHWAVYWALSLITDFRKTERWKNFGKPINSSWLFVGNFYKTEKVVVMKRRELRSEKITKHCIDFTRTIVFGNNNYLSSRFYSL